MKIRKQITVCRKDAELNIYPESRNELGLYGLRIRLVLSLLQMMHIVLKA